MATTEYVLDSLTDMDRYLRLMTADSGAAGIVNAVSAYLASWTNDRIRNLQKVDGGWAPFDEHQRPTPLHGVADIPRICDSVRAQCVALKKAGIGPTPEFLELDLFLFFARQMVEDHEAVRSRASPVLAHSNGYRHWPDRQSVGRES